MSDAFTVLWTHDVCRALRKEGRTGQRPPVAYSGVHSSLPSWSSAKPGDEVYALHVNKCVVHVVSRMRIVDSERDACCGAKPEDRRDPAYPGHDAWWMLGAGGCGATAVHVQASPVSFELTLPGDLLERLQWRNLKGKTRNLKYLEDGRLTRALSIQGFYRLTADSGEELARLVPLQLSAPASARV